MNACKYTKLNDGKIANDAIHFSHDSLLSDDIEKKVECGKFG
jgi:hypothetical protein